MSKSATSCARAIANAPRKRASIAREQSGLRIAQRRIDQRARERHIVVREQGLRLVIVAHAHEFAEDLPPARGCRRRDGLDATGSRRQSNELCAQLRQLRLQRRNIDCLQCTQCLDFGGDALAHAGKCRIVRFGEGAVGKSVRGERRRGVAEQSIAFATQHQQQFGFVEQQRVMPGKTLLGEIRDRVFGKACALGQAKHLAAQRFIHLGRIVETRAQTLGFVASRLHIARQRIDLVAQLLRLRLLAARGSVVALLDHLHAPVHIGRAGDNDEQHQPAACARAACGRHNVRRAACRRRRGYCGHGIFAVAFAHVGMLANSRRRRTSRDDAARARGTRRRACRSRRPMPQYACEQSRPGAPRARGAGC